MDMNDDSPTAPVSPDDLAVYALDAHDADDAAAIVAHLDASPDIARWEQDLRSAAGEFAAAVVNDVTPPPSCGLGCSPRHAAAGSPPRWLPAPRRSTCTASRWRGRSCCCTT